MKTMDSRFLLIDLQSSCYSARQMPLSTTLTYLSTLSSSFRRTRGVPRRVCSSRSSTPPVIRAPEIRRPSDWSRRGNGSSSESDNSVSTSSSLGSVGHTELEPFLELLPPEMRSELIEHKEIGGLIEVVLDLGRKPLARFPSGDWIISEQTVRHEDLRHAISKVGEFSDDNRSGINSSLHRISAIRNRKLQIIGLTCRVGRAISGSAEIIRDLVEKGGSILVIGRPGVGKTTLIREIARMLADDQRKRVIIVDTSNEIGGDGDVPHAGIGRARRMQVPNVNLQHNVMIEAVENHMPEAIIIDEIGTELEALAASTIAQRGVQLVGTAHGMTIDNIMKNPSLQILVGGIESVTLGDDEARRRKVQKTILERKGPPTFTCAVEMISRTECRVHHQLDATVDAILAGKTPLFEVRYMDAEGDDCLHLTPIAGKNNAEEPKLMTVNKDKGHSIGSDEEEGDYSLKLTPIVGKNNAEPKPMTVNKDKGHDAVSDEEDEYYPPNQSKKLRTNGFVRRNRPVCVYTYKILEADLLDVASVMGLEGEIEVTDDIETADAILVSSSEMKVNPWIRSVAKYQRLRIFVIKSNSMAQMVKAVSTILGMESFGSSKHPRKGAVDIEIADDAPESKPSLEEIDALEEVRMAIEYIVIPGGEPVELLPRCSEIMARQLQLVESYQLIAENSGTELSPRLQILPQRTDKKTSKSLKPSKTLETGTNLETILNNSAGTSVTRLPLLPE